MSRAAQLRVLAFIGLAVAVAVGFALYNAQQNDICDGQNEGRTILRGLLQASQAQAAGGQRIPVTIIYPDDTRQKVTIITQGSTPQTEKFYREQIARSQPIRC